MKAYRTKDLDQDWHDRDHVDGHQCVKCGKPIKGEPQFWVRTVDGGNWVLHPQDGHAYYQHGDHSQDAGVWPLGPDCAKKIGREWRLTHPAQMVYADLERESKKEGY